MERKVSTAAIQHTRGSVSHNHPRTCAFQIHQRYTEQTVYNISG